MGQTVILLWILILLCYLGIGLSFAMNFEGNDISNDKNKRWTFLSRFNCILLWPIISIAYLLFGFPGDK